MGLNREKRFNVQRALSRLYGVDKDVLVSKKNKEASKT